MLGLSLWVLGVLSFVVWVGCLLRFVSCCFVIDLGVYFLVCTVFSLILLGFANCGLIGWKCLLYYCCGWAY